MYPLKNFFDEVKTNLASESARGSNYTYVLFTPCATSTGKYIEALIWLQNKGFEVLQTAWVDFVREILPDLYPVQYSSFPIAANIADIYYDLDVCLLVLLRDTTGGSASQRLRELKGHSIPAKRESDCLRNYLGSDSRMLNMVHTPDDDTRAGDELDLFSNYSATRVNEDIQSLYEWENAPVKYRQRSVSYEDRISLLRSLSYGAYHERKAHIDKFLEGTSDQSCSMEDISKGLILAGMDTDSIMYKWTLVIMSAYLMYR